MKFKSLAVVALALTISACAGSQDEDANAGAAQAVDTAKREVAVAATTTPSYPPGSQEELNAEIGDRVFFDTDRHELKPEARQLVGFWASWMQEHQNVALLIEGHADERGTREYNLSLGARRANAVREYLGALGVDGSRVRTVSFGKERPAVLGSNAQAWAQNRRSVAIVE